MFANVLMAIVADFMLVWLPAPAFSLGWVALKAFEYQPVGTGQSQLAMLSLAHQKKYL